MTAYPSYVRRMLAEAREEGQWYAAQPQAAATCFEVLAQFPDCQEAAELVYELFCDEWLIYDNRNAVQQQIDEWDDRPHQQRRRLALSFRFMSRWDGYNDDAEDDRRSMREGPREVRELLAEGRGRLLHAYCLGDEECSDVAWPLFVEAFERASNPQKTMRWVANTYADLGFFADAAEVLATLCSRFADNEARRLLAEVCWWRDNAHRLHWLPPPGDGSRFLRMMRLTEPDFRPEDEEAVRQELRQRIGLPSGSAWQLPPLDASLNALLQPRESVGAAAAPSPVDWSFLDQDDGQPGEMPEWAKKQIKLFGKRLPADYQERFRYSRPIAPPATPKRYHPDDGPPDLDDEDDDFDVDLDLDDED